MRLAVLLALVLLAASLAACGSSDSGSGTTRGEDAQRRPGQPGAPAGAGAEACAAAGTRAEALRVIAVSCGEGRRVALTWRHRGGCEPGGGASRAGCRLGSYRCTAVRAERGFAVSCARPGRTVAFIVPRG